MQPRCFKERCKGGEGLVPGFRGNKKTPCRAWETRGDQKGVSWFVEGLLWANANTELAKDKRCSIQYSTSSTSMYNWANSATSFLKYEQANTYICVSTCLCVNTMLGGEERGLGAWWVFRPGGHQLDGPHVFVGQLPQTGLPVLDHLLNGCMLLKRFHYLGLAEREIGQPI